MDIQLLIGLVGVFAAAAFVIYTLLERVEERSTVRASLRSLEGYEIANVRDQELLNPVTDRVVRPVMSGLSQLARRFTPVGYIETSRRKLTSAGYPEAHHLDRFLAMRVVSILLIPFWLWFTFRLIPIDSSGNKLIIFALLAVASALGPDAILNRKMEERAHAIRVKLPDVLDLLTISVEAGLGFEQALDRTVASVPGPLSDEFSRMLGEVRAGAARADAMRAMDERINVGEVRSFVLAILQADTFGVSIGRILRAQAEEARIKRRQLAQEQAQKAPVKMLIPMVFCIFPALFVVVIGPAAINIARNL